MKKILLTLLFTVTYAAVFAQSTYDAMAPFGFATCTSRTDAGNTSNITGGGGYTYPIPSDVASSKKVVTLLSSGNAMDSEIESAISNNDIIIFDGSNGDFILKAYVEMKDMSGKTLLGINNAKLCTEWYATTEDVAALENAGVSKMSTSGGGGTLDNNTYVKEEAEYNTRKIMIERYNDLSEWWRKSGIFYISGCTNIIIRNLKFQGPGAMDLGGADLVSVIKSCKNIWVDHCEFYDGQDGNFDITNLSDMVTVSWCTFSYTGRSYMHQNTNLCGSSDDKTDDDDKLSITWAYNMWGKGCAARMPMARFGRFHMLNNYYNCAGNKTSCINPRINSEFLIEGNYFESDIQKIYEANSATKVIWRSNNVYGNGISSTLPTADDVTATNTLIPYTYTLISPTSPTVKNHILTNVGATIFVSSEKNTNITATVDGTEASFSNDSYTYSFDAPDAKTQYSVVLTLPTGATVSSVSGATLADGTTYNIAAPAEGATAYATFTITSADGTVNHTYTIVLQSISNVRYADVKTSGNATIYYWNQNNGSTTKSNFKVVTGNYKTYSVGSEITYLSEKYRYGLKMESSTEAQLKVTQKSDVIFVFDVSSKRFSLNGTTCTTDNSNIYSTQLESGTYTIKKIDAPNLMAIYVTPTSDTPQPTLYTVTFETNGHGTCSMTEWVQASEEENTTLPTATADEGYTFLGWSTSSTATVAEYVAGDSFTPADNVTLYAIWKEIEQPTPSSDDNTDSDGNVICNTFWKFDDEGFESSYTTSKTVRGLTISADTSKEISIDGSNKEYSADNLSFTKRLKFGGTGSTASRNVSFKVIGPCTIEVWGMSSSTSDRTLVISTSTSSNNILYNVGSELTKGTYDYNGTGETIYLYSQNSGFNIYGIRITYPDYQLTIGSALWASLYLPYATIVPDGVKVYYGNSVEESSIALEEISDVIPANTGVVANGSTGTYTFKAANNNGQNINSVFYGVTADTSVENLKTRHSATNICTLGRSNGTIGIYRYTGTTVKKNSIYLPISSSNAKSAFSIFIPNEDTITGIEKAGEGISADNIVYNLNGQRVFGSSAKGIVIKNGKKVIVR